MGPSPFVSFQEGLQDMTLAGAFVARLARSRSASLRSILAPAFPLPPLKLSQSSSPLFFPVDDDACLVRRKSWLAVVHLLVAQDEVSAFDFQLGTLASQVRHRHPEVIVATAHFGRAVLEDIHDLNAESNPASDRFPRHDVRLNGCRRKEQSNYCKPGTY